MSGNYVLVVDQGTTGTRAVLVDSSGAPLERSWSYVEHRQIYPKPGWVEHDPEEIWSCVKLVVRECIERSGVDPRKIVAMAVTNQRETIVVWDPRSGRPLYNAIVWQCRRSAPLLERVRSFEKLVRERTGLVLDPYFSASKIWWLLENVEGLRQRAERGEAVFGTIDSWIVWRATRGSRDVETPEMGGAFVTDYSNASRTMLFDIRRLDWSDDLLEIFGRIPRHSLPLPMPSAHCYGYLGPEMERVVGASIPICAAVGDQQAALFGQACFSRGLAKATLGTGTFVLMSTGSDIVLSRSGLLTTVFYSLERKRASYALEGSIFATGAVIKWLIEGLGIVSRPEEVDELAASVRDSEGVYLVPALTGLGAPYWDPYARGLIIGITRSSTRAHVVRAALESVAFMVRDVLEAMASDAGCRIEELRIDGGAARSRVLPKLVADLAGVRVVKPRFLETTSLGAAYLAGIAAGIWRGVSEIEKLWRASEVIEPSMSEEERRARYEAWREAVRRCMGWARLTPWIS